MSELDDLKQELLRVQYQLVTGKNTEGDPLSSEERNALWEREAQLLSLINPS